MLIRNEIRNIILKSIVYMPAFLYHMNEYDIRGMVWYHCIRHIIEAFVAQ